MNVLIAIMLICGAGADLRSRINSGKVADGIKEVLQQRLNSMSNSEITSITEVATGKGSIASSSASSPVAAPIAPPSHSVESPNADNEPDVLEPSCSFSSLQGADKVKASEYSACMKKIPIENPSDFRSYVTAINRVFAEWYVFYDVAADAVATRPNGVGPKDAGNYIYNGTLHGKVDLNKRLTALANTKAPKLSDFWALNSIQVALRDGHAHFEGHHGTYGQKGLDSAVQAETHLSPESSYAYAPKFRMLGDDPDSIEMSITNIDTNVSEKVKLFNGMAPKELLYYLADYNGATTSFYNIKDTGARINAVINEWTGEVPFPQQALLTDPQEFFPDEFPVVYESGHREVWTTRTSVAPNVANLISLSKPVPASVFETGKAGNLYREFVHAFQSDLDLDNVQELVRLSQRELNTATPPAPIPPAPTPPAPTPKQHHADGKQFDWVELFFDGRVRYYVGETYAVLKVTSFDSWQPTNSSTIRLSKLLKVFDVAKDKGVKHLIVDISNNGGGDPDMAYGLAQCMYPNMTFEYFDNVYNFVYSETMQVYAREVQPFLNNKLPATMEQPLLDELSLKQASKIAGMIKLIHTLITLKQPGNQGIASWHNGLTNLQDQTAMANNLVEAGAAWLKDKGTQTNLTLAHHVFTQLLNVSAYFNPWTSLEAESVKKTETDLGPMNQTALTFQRGNQKNVKFTRPYQGYEQETYNRVQKESMAACSPFKSYVVLGNGAAGSATNTFESTVTGWDVTNSLPDDAPKYTSVSYGGNGATPLTQFAAGFAKTPNLFDNYIALAVLNATAVALEGTKYGTEAARLCKKFHATIPDVPFYANDLPYMPGSQVMSGVYGGMKSMPMEYMYLPPLHTINQFYRGGADDADIWELYDETAKRFFPTT